MSNNLTIVAHWATLVENMNTSAQEFYIRVEEAILSRRIPDLNTTRVMWYEGGVLSAQREYLRITRGRYVYDICAAPFGTGYFFSSWMAEQLPSPLWAIISFCIILFTTFFSFLFLIYYLFLLGVFIWFFCSFVGWAIIIAVLVAGESFIGDYIFVVPYVGPFLEQIFRPTTYYRQDTQAMFQKMVHNAVMEAVDVTVNAVGARKLTEEERKPVMREFFSR